MTKRKAPIIGAAIAVLGVLSLIILMLVLAVLQITGLVHIDFAWWMVMVLLLPTILVVGAYVSSVGARRAEKRERAAFERAHEARRAQIRAEREERIARQGTNGGLGF